MTLRLGLIGLGRWGRAHSNTLNQLAGLSLVAAAGRTRCEDETGLRPWLPETAVHYDTWEALVQNADLDGVIVTTPPGPRFTIAQACLQAGIPIYLEKPVAASLSQVKALVTLSEETGTPFFTGHLHISAPAYKAMKQAVGSSAGICRIQSAGGNHGPFRNDYRALLDYGPHDISMILDLMQTLPKSVSATRAISSDIATAEVIEAVLTFDTCKADIRVGNLFKKKTRLLQVDTQDGRYIYDDLAEEKAVFLAKNSLEKRPFSFAKEPPLTASLTAFASMISENSPLSSEQKWQALGVGIVMDAIAQSIQSGAPVQVSQSNLVCE